jgi:hypothetical protein
MAGALRACEDAAGNFATYLMLQFGEGQGTPRMMIGSGRRLRCRLLARLGRATCIERRAAYGSKADLCQAAARRVYEFMT